MTAIPPEPSRWIKYLLDIYETATPPVMGTVAVKEIEDKAREVMKDHLRACYHPLEVTPFDLCQRHICTPLGVLGRGQQMPQIGVHLSGGKSSLRCSGTALIEVSK